MAGRRHAGAAALLCLGLLCLASSALAFKGEGTAYSGPGDKDATGKNACGFGDLGSKFETWYAAMNSQQFDGSCGRCIKARGTERPVSGKWHVVKIVDMCPSCSHGDVDFSSTAFKAITGLAWDRKSIEWEWTDCNQEAADKKMKEEEKRKAAEKKAAEQKRKEEEQRKKEEADRKRAAEDKARQEAERAKAEEEAAQAQQAQQAGEAVQGQLVSPAGSQTVASANATAGAESATATASAGMAEQERPVSDWVVRCAEGRQRCPNLSLAARGYQCTTLDGSACCLTPSGKLCKLLANYEEDTAALAYWRGRNLAGGSAGNASKEATQLNKTGGSTPAAANEAAAGPAAPVAAAPSPAAAERPAKDEAQEESAAESVPTKEPAPSPAAAPAGRRMLKH
ncbi:Trafficking particle complex subunit 5 [Chlorella sorokiniana]|uniref:Trafficking particle complex subunit 5 n=1 Tax=Chlorella sorokiniana TaxID=3076 RepID=A0A2P6U2C3_CHLSO|nr:Trafficking particle complex subunit 5 [Chlorella sorokiniana]|eukprot:PRW60471.1 Trafficking particle complex subunit 5 [Chlorella sorokiniana]